MRGAFGLIELLVVIGMLAALAALLLPALTAARSHAGTLKGLSHLSQIGQGTFTYAEAYDQTLPIGYLHFPDQPHRNANWTTLLNGQLAGGAMTDDQLDRRAFLPIFRDPNAALDGGRVHYSAHPVLMPDLTRDANGQIVRPIKKPYRTQRLKRSGDVVMVMDGCQDEMTSFNARATAWRIDGESLWTQWAYDASDSDNLQPIDPGPDRDDTRGRGDIRWRQFHAAANFLYTDGHADTRRPPSVRRANIRVD